MYRISLCCISDSSKSKGNNISNEPPRMATYSTTKSHRADHENSTGAPRIVIHHTSLESVVKHATPEPHHLHPFYRSQRPDSRLGKKFQDTLGSLREEDEAM
ncbi:hypothetical protein BTUL_0306g00030 [Botrytis tulipae]|uniref:Uncharacterized protein n=1 Tax=Botrytis tulipae TaxID=87230 RepID=A0A4Z1E5F4_9HELO|nr:hypothetical protein BTUL_0306g00030 [Botrytis tulipae]